MTDGPNEGPPPSMPPPPPGWAAGGTGPQPGVIPLRPLGVGDILQGAVATIRRHPALMLGISAVVVTITQVVAHAATYPLLVDLNRIAREGQPVSADQLADTVLKGLGSTGIAVLVALLGQVFLAGFLTVVVGKAVLGKPASFAGEWARVRPRLPALLGVTGVYLLAAAVGVLAVVAIAAAVPPLAPLVAIGLFVVAVWLLIRYSLTTSALMLENAPIGRAFQRSAHLVRGTWWRIFGITLLAQLIAGLVGLVITLPFDAIGGGMNPETALSAAAITLGTIGAIIASTLTEPFVAAVVVLLYTDQRIRREGMAGELTRAAEG